MDDNSILWIKSRYLKAGILPETSLGLFFLERGKRVEDGILSAGTFYALEYGEGNLTDGERHYVGTFPKYDFGKVVSGKFTSSFNESDWQRRYDLMIEADGNSFAIFQLDSVRVVPDPSDASDCNISIKFAKSWPDCSRKGAKEIEALICGIRREISLSGLGI